MVSWVPARVHQPPPFGQEVRDLDKARPETYGLSCFVAHEDITPSKEWQATIEACLATCDVCVVIIDDEFHGSYWTDQEVGWCAGRGVLVIPVCTSTIMPYGFAGKYQALKAYDPKDVDDAIFTVITHDRRLSPRLDHALVSAFASACSFANAKRTASRLYYVKEWNDVLRAKVAAAIKDNNQVVPEAKAAARRHAGIPMPVPLANPRLSEPGPDISS